MKIVQIKEGNTTCRVQVWWQNKVVHDGYFGYQNYDSGIGLYVAGDQSTFIDGQVRNFSFVKK